MFMYLIGSSQDQTLDWLAVQANRVQPVPTKVPTGDGSVTQTPTKLNGTRKARQGRHRALGAVILGVADHGLLQRQAICTSASPARRPVAPPSWSSAAPGGLADAATPPAAADLAADITASFAARPYPLRRREKKKKKKKKLPPPPKGPPSSMSNECFLLPCPPSARPAGGRVDPAPSSKLSC